MSIAPSYRNPSIKHLPPFPEIEHAFLGTDIIFGTAFYVRGSGECLALAGRSPSALTFESKTFSDANFRSVVKSTARLSMIFGCAPGRQVPASPEQGKISQLGFGFRV